MFFCLKMCSATFLWFTICVVNIAIGKLILSLLVSHERNMGAKRGSGDETKNTCDACIFFLDNAFSFVDVVDSKLIGLSVFLVANVFTGLVNLTFDSKQLPNVCSLLILFINSVVSTFLPFCFYYYYFLKNKRK